MTERDAGRRDDAPGQAAGAANVEGEGPAQAAQATSDELEALRQELDEANRKGQEYLSLVQRVQADFVNYRRRVEQERGESILAGKAQLAQRILPILDDFERALRAMPADLAQNPWVQGVEQIARKLRTALESEGITRIEALGQEFNPWEHEAMMHGPSSQEEAGKVTEVFEEGYKLGSKVLRPARVKVGSGP